MDITKFTKNVLWNIMTLQSCTPGLSIREYVRFALYDKKKIISLFSTFIVYHVTGIILPFTCLTATTWHYTRKLFLVCFVALKSSLYLVENIWTNTYVIFKYSNMLLLRGPQQRKLYKEVAEKRKCCKKNETEIWTVLW